MNECLNARQRAFGRVCLKVRRRLDAHGMGHSVMAVSAGIIVAWSILLLYLVTVAYYAVLY